MQMNGSCLCGKVEFTVEIAEKEVDSCHCSMCRKWSGSPALAVTSSQPIKILQNEDSVEVYSSSDWAERAFCKSCGTHLYYRLKEAPFWSVPVGTLKDQSDFKFTKQIYVDHKPDYYEFANSTEMMTEKQVLAAFGVQE